MDWKYLTHVKWQYVFGVRGFIRAPYFFYHQNTTPTTNHCSPVVELSLKLREHSRAHLLHSVESMEKAIRKAIKIRSFPKTCVISLIPSLLGRFLPYPKECVVSSIVLVDFPPASFYVYQTLRFADSTTYSLKDIISDKKTMCLIFGSTLYPV